VYAQRLDSHAHKHVRLDAIKTKLGPRHANFTALTFQGFRVRVGGRQHTANTHTNTNTHKHTLEVLTSVHM
jgi:hypothetical protein